MSGRDPKRRAGFLPVMDAGLVVAAFGLSCIGVLLVWSATRHDFGNSYLVRGVINLGVGVALGVFVMRWDPRSLKAWVPAVYAVAVLALLAVLGPLGSTVNGSRSWIELPGFSVQPAELAKVALAVTLAAALAVPGERSARPERRDVLVGLGLAAVPLGLVMLQPDLGSALVLSSLVFVAFAAAGVARRWMTAGLLLAIAAACTALFTPVLAAYQRNRLLAFIRPDADPSGIGYQVQQVKLAIGSGGVFGQGLFHGRSTQGGFVPFQYTDFVFSVAGEELGLVGALGVVVLELFLVARALVVARRSSEPFGRILCAGVAGWLFFQALENIGMNLGLMPVTGVPLPFVSYGGSSLFVCWIAIGLVGNVHAREQRGLS